MSKESSIKVYIIVNTDLNMSKGKTISQACHAIAAITRLNEKNKSRIYSEWINNGEPIIVLKSSENQINQLLHTNSKSKGLKYVEIYDAGLTQVKADSLTCIAFHPTTELDELKKFKLM
jgi:PTH2 family peptidyl-tRNA hydrolase